MSHYKGCLPVDVGCHPKAIVNHHLGFNWPHIQVALGIIAFVALVYGIIGLIVRLQDLRRAKRSRAGEAESLWEFVSETPFGPYLTVTCIGWAALVVTSIVGWLLIQLLALFFWV